MDNKNYEEYAYCSKEAMKWYGWGSPVGLTIFFIGLGIVAILIRYIICGKL